MAGNHCAGKQGLARLIERKGGQKCCFPFEENILVGGEWEGLLWCAEGKSLMTIGGNSVIIHRCLLFLCLSQDAMFFPFPCPSEKGAAS